MKRAGWLAERRRISEETDGDGYHHLLARTR